VIKLYLEPVLLKTVKSNYNCKRLVRSGSAG